MESIQMWTVGLSVELSKRLHEDQAKVFLKTKKKDAKKD